MDSYYDTAQRMYKSAKILHNNSEYHNACYLAGYVLECYSKIVVGMSYPLTHQELSKEFSHDLEKLRKELDYILASSSISAHIRNLRAECPTIISGQFKWNPIKRYIQDRDRWNQANSNNYQSEVEIVMTEIARMKLNLTHLI